MARELQAADCTIGDIAGISDTTRFGDIHVMTLDTTQILIAVIILIFVVDAIKDLVRESRTWRLIEVLSGGQRAPSFPVPPPPVVVPPPPGPIPVPDPGPPPVTPIVPDKPPVVPDKPPVTPPIIVTPPVTPPVPPAPGIPRFTGITTTSFAGISDSDFSKRSAYTGKIIDSNTPGAALPYHFPGTPPTIRVFFRGKTVDCPIVDVGPWNTHDPYWDHGARPQAESGTDTTGRHTNRAGLDLTPGAWAEIGKTGNLDAVTDVTSWDFVSVLDKGNVEAVVPPPVGPGTVGGTVLQHNVWPTQAECPSFYGSSEAAVQANLVNVQVPWLMNGKTHSIPIHKKCAESLTRVVNFIWEQCGKSQDQIHKFGYDIFDGSFNWRVIAGTNTPSVHSYGAAIDFDAARNPQYATKTEFKSDSLITTAFETEGWVWGGRWSVGSVDNMHYQAARVR